MDTNNKILDLSLDFAFQIISYCELLEKNKKYVIAKQLLKSGTSIGANILDAQNAENEHEFIHKIKIAAKEVEETEYWLLLCKKSKTYPKSEVLFKKLVDIKKILNSIITVMKTKVI